MKKAQSEIITTIIIILLVLVAVVIVWQVINPFIKESSEDIQTEVLSVDLAASNFRVVRETPAEAYLEVDVNRGSDTGKLDSIIFLFYYEDGTTKTYKVKDSSITGHVIRTVVNDPASGNTEGTAQLMNPLETVTFKFPRVITTINLIAVTATPVYKGKIGVESEKTNYDSVGTGYGTP